AKVEASGTSQTCPECDAHVSKNLSIRVHECPKCGYKTDRDVASAQVIRSRGVSAVGLTVAQIACGRDASGTDGDQSRWHRKKQEFPRSDFGKPLP
ncbi:MAG: zinc ribbon domain-containing protein, partial [Coleofasciculaceae cyanobacterium]